jgi:aspartyl-tRNA(Asn)/glutamyl-tRNA(Gln) amidotransferase subunit C
LFGHGNGLPWVGGHRNDESIDFLRNGATTPASPHGWNMALTDKEVQHIATLARIRLSDAELPHYANEINGILKWIAQLEEVNTDGVAPLASVSEQLLPWRADVVNDGGIQEQILKNAPSAQYGCFAVPKVIE